MGHASDQYWGNTSVRLKDYGKHGRLNFRSVKLYADGSYSLFRFQTIAFVNRYYKVLLGLGVQHCLNLTQIDQRRKGSWSILRSSLRA